VASFRTVALCVVLLEVTAAVVFEVVVVAVGEGFGALVVVGAVVGSVVVVAAGSTKLTRTGSSLGFVSS
jgi:hypothetical protein